jgi:CRISPR/Cas system-associated endoribonuclease Cas2
MKSILTDAIYRKHKECNGIKRIVQLHSQRVQWNVFHCTLGKWNFLTIQYHVIINSQLNDHNSIRYYLIYNILQGKN